MRTIEVDSSVSLNSIVIASPDQVSSDLAGEVIVLDLKSGVYYGLCAVGARIWNLLNEPRSVSEIRDIILDEYDVEPDRCVEDLKVLLDEMLGRGLIEVKNETGG